MLIARLPPRPSSLRVRAWRRLRAVGAVALKGSVYLLPLSPENQEHFQWLAQEIQKDGGEGTLLRVERIETMGREEVVRLFRDARDADYRRLADRYRRLLAGLAPAGGPRAGRPRARRAAGTEEARRLARELARIREIDFFEAPGQAEVERLRDAVEQRLQAPRAGPPGPPAEPGRYRGRRWVTRPRPHVDRLASAWLVKRFIDPEAEFLFLPADAFPPDAVAYDAPGAAFAHQGDLCTFETLLARFGLRDRRLGELAEIVHDLDLRDERFGRPETRGLDLVLRGLLATLEDDGAVLGHGLALFDGLYAALGPRPAR